MQGGMGMGRGTMGGRATWSTNIAGGGAKTGMSFQKWFQSSNCSQPHDGKRDGSWHL